MSADGKRLREIISTLGVYGFNQIYRGHFRNKITPEESAKNLRKAFEKLGPSFIKIGQILSTRNDLLSDPYIYELKKLQNSSPSFSYEAADAVFEGEFHLTLEEAFQTIEHEPFATGSIAQIHRAILDDGREVVVKIQRPNIYEELIRDINLFIRVVKTIPSIFTEVIIDPIDILNEIKKQSIEEMNFIHEAQNMLLFRQYQSQRAYITAPEPYLPYVSKKILVQEYIEGVDLSKRHVLIEKGFVLSEVAREYVLCYLSQVFEDGFYHGDPHPGNILLKEDQMVFIDFGMVGRLSGFYQQFLVQIMEAVVMKNIDQLLELLLIACRSRGDLDRKAFYNDLSFLYNRYLIGSLENIKLDELFQDVMKLAWKYNLVLPNELVLLAKTIIMVQGVAQRLDPEMDFMALFTRFFFSKKHLLFRQAFDKAHIARKATRLFNVGMTMPEKIDQLMDNVNKERLTVNLNLNHIDQRIREINQMINRMVSALILSAIIVSSGYIVSTGNSERYTTVGFIFFTVGVALALYLLYSFIRSRFK